MTSLTTMARAAYQGAPPEKESLIDLWAETDRRLSSVIHGIDIQLPHVNLCTTGNVTLSGEQTIDGTLTSATRILVAYQTAPAQNGVYVTGAGAWTRATDANTTAELYRAAVYVLAGTANGGNTFVCTIAEAAVLGTDPCPWSLHERSDTSGLAPLASPAFTGNPTAPTPAQGDNDTSIATTAFVSLAVATEANTRNTAISNVSATIAAEIATRALADTNLATAINVENIRIDELEPFVTNEREREQFWSVNVSGRPENRASLDSSYFVINADGAAIRVTGNATIAPRTAYRIRAGHVLDVEWAVRRSTNPADPLGDSVSLMIAWLNNSYAVIGTTTLVEAINLTVANGRVARTKKLAAASGLGADIVGPAGTIYAVPYYQTFGPDGVTDLDWPLVVDQTSLLDLSAEISDQLADLGDISAAIAAAEDAADRAEAALAAINGTPGVNGLFSNVRLAKTAAYTVVNGDKGKTIALGGSACYNLTFPTASTLDNEFGVIVINEDADRAKFIVLPGGSGTHKLWPKQQAMVLNVNDVWKIDIPQRWKLTTQTIFYCDVVNGNNANDGLAPGAGGAWQNPMNFYVHIAENIDVGGAHHLVMELADGTYDVNMHLATHLVGRDGGENFVLRGENTTGTIIRPTTSDAIGIFTGQSVFLRNLRLEAPAGSCLTSAQGGNMLYVGENVVFGDCSGNHIIMTDGHLLIDDYTIDGSAGGYHMAATDRGQISGQNKTVTITDNVSFGLGFALAGAGATVNVTGMTYDLGAFTVTGRRFVVATGGHLITGTNNQNYFPGTIAGTNTTGVYGDQPGQMTYIYGQTFAATNGFPATFSYTSDGTSGPQTISQHVTTSPATFDIIYAHLMQAPDDTLAMLTYAQTNARIDDPTNGSEDGLYDIRTVRAGTANIRATFGSGLQMAGATGGDKGSGTINATAVYDDNVLLSCYVFDQAFDKKISTTKWDSLVPDRKTEIMKNVIETIVDDDGVEKSFRTSKSTGKFKVEKRTHEPMRKFRDRAGTEYDPLTLDGYIAHCRDKRHLPSMPNEKKFDPEQGMPAGAWIQRLLEDAEIKAVLMMKMHNTNTELETRLAKTEAALEELMKKLN